MEQHPVPQQISTYQFRLIGDMTLRQFSQLAGGGVVAFFFYSLPIIPFIKWFLVLFFGFLGFALAFLPLEDRPLDKWIVSFFRSIYSPTQYLWRKEKRIPEFLKAYSPKLVEKTAVPVLSPTPRAGLTDYLETFTVPTLETKSEKEEKLALEKIEALYETTKLPANMKAQPKIQPQSQQKLSDLLMPQMKIKPRKLSVPPSAPIMFNMGLPVPGKPGVRKAEPLVQAQAKGETIPGPKTKIKPSKRKEGQVRVEATTSVNLPIPTTPSQPNIIVGMIVDNQGMIVERAIIEIRDKNGLPVRALRSNRLGQFQIVTPLPNGTYEIEVEKEELKFDIIKLNLTGEIVSPIDIKAK